MGMFFLSKINPLHPARILALGFLIIIFVGSLMLYLPLAYEGDSISYIDSLFTALLTSATARTAGFSVVDSNLLSYAALLVIIALMSMLFEVFSAFGTVGLSTGITPELSTPSKITLIITMFCGRIGPLTLLVAVTRTKTKDDGLKIYRRRPYYRLALRY
jgi:Trk-type K+ transport system membrane component